MAVKKPTRRKGDDDPRTGREEQLECVVSLRLTPSDHEVWLSKVLASGQTRSEFFRSCVLGNKTEVVAKLPASADRQRLLFLFNNASNNINQIAHVVNLANFNGVLSEAVFLDVLNNLNATTGFLRAGIANVD